MKYLYGITPEEFDAQLERQSGQCAICGWEKKPEHRPMNVDHDHKTLRLRGILCFFCNKFVVSSRMTPARLRAAADYLENPPWPERYAPRKK